jgi:hypothetical protein
MTGQCRQSEGVLRPVTHLATVQLPATSVLSGTELWLEKQQIKQEGADE